MNYYPWHIGDYAAATKHLSWDEDMAYRRLLDWYYLNERPLPADLVRVCRLVQADTDERKSAVTAVLYEFFEETEEGWRQKRADDEIAEMQLKVEASESRDGNKQTRLQRFRADRARMFQALAAVGIVPSFNIPMGDLRRLFNKHGNARSVSSAPNDETGLETALETNKNVSATTIPTPTPTPTPLEIHDSLTGISARPPAEAAGDDEGEFKLNGHAYEPPDCPHQELLALWAEVMSDQVQHDPDLWRGTRAQHLRARWRETAERKKWVSKAQGLAYFRKFFEWCRQSPFLMGKVPPRAGHKQFELELAWLVNPTNWTKAHEGKYHSQQG